MAYELSFEKAVDHEMLYEVGSWWKLTPDVEAGLINTEEQRTACGYSNDPADHGGETKFGVSKAANPDLNITSLDWEAAKRVYYKRYWLQGDCQQMPPRLAVLHFDGCVNHGIGRAAKFLQKSIGTIADGDIGPATLALISKFNEIDICNKICDQRANFYRSIVYTIPTQGKYLGGWLRRVQEMREFTTNPANIFQ